jgi:hypothetical protein
MNYETKLFNIYTEYVARYEIAERIEYDLFKTTHYDDYLKGKNKNIHDFSYVISRVKYNCTQRIIAIQYIIEKIVYGIDMESPDYDESEIKFVNDESNVTEIIEDYYYDKYKKEAKKWYESKIKDNDIKSIIDKIKDVVHFDI